MIHPDRDILILYVDRVLPESEMTSIRAHAEECLQCSDALARERQFSEALRAQPMTEPSSGFDRIVLDAVIPAATRERRGEATVRRYAGLITLCVVTLVVILIALGQGGESSDWMQPVSETINTATRSLTNGFVDGLNRLLSPLKVIQVSNGVLDIFALAVLALLVLGGLDRILSPLVKKGR